MPPPHRPKWISTTYTLLLLKRLGLPQSNKAARRGCAMLWDSTIFNGGITWKTATSKPDICISAFWLHLAAYFGHQDHRIPAVIDWVLDNQLADGAWNCDQIRTGSQHSSYHTSIQVLEAFAEIGDDALEPAAERAREFFLEHRMYRSHRTGEPSHPAYTKLSFPPRWRYDILRGLDHFQAVGAPADERLSDALDVVRSKQRKDGFWPVQNKHAGKVWFDMETGRRPSRWNTLRALRVLRWAEQDS